MKRVALLWLGFISACTTAEIIDDGGALVDAGSVDGGTGADASDSGGAFDATGDAGPNDVGPSDTGLSDAGPSDSGLTDAGAFDASPLFVYVGSSDDSIHRYGLGPSGALTPLGTTAAGNNPSFLAIDPSRRFLYAVNEGGGGRVAAFAIDPSDGDLTFLNRVSSNGGGPAHLSVDATGGFVLVANYGGGTVTVLPIEADGSLGAATDTESPGDNAHLITTDPANRFAFVPCLGSNLVAQFVFDATLGTLTPNAVATVASAPGAGPRHLAFHPQQPWAYVINELGSSMTSYDYDAATGRLTANETITTLPAGFTGNNSTAEVVVHPNGRFVLGSNRGDDSIVVFSVDQATGRLTVVDHTDTGGQTPRNFTLTPDGSVLLVANQGTGDIHAFAMDPVTGALGDLGPVADVDGPAFVGVVPLP